MGAAGRTCGSLASECHRFLTLFGDSVRGGSGQRGFKFCLFVGLVVSRCVVFHDALSMGAPGVMHSNRFSVLELASCCFHMSSAWWAPDRSYSTWVSR